MKILVTGGAGFIGANFIFYMLKNHPEHEIVCLDALTYAGNLETLESVMDDPRFKFVKGDVADREAVFKLFEEEKFDVVVNFAASDKEACDTVVVEFAAFFKAVCCNLIF